jgi:hypothetical protein
MSNEKIAEVVKIMDILEKKMQSMVDKNNNLKIKVDQTIVKTENLLETNKHILMLN